MLEKEFEFYKKNQTDLVSKYNGKTLAIKECKVIGVYNSEFEAVTQTEKEHELGTFLIQKCEPGEESFSATYHSRVVFAQA